MSTWYSQELICPQCQATFREMLAAGIHAKRVPQVRQQILTGQLHQVTCPACGLELEVHCPLAYTDFDRFHWIELTVPEQRSNWDAVERDALARFDRGLTAGAPLAATISDRFLVRIVFDLDELRERLLIWDAGYDDGIVEAIKLQSLRERPSLLAEQRRIRLHEITPEGGLVMASVYAGAPRQLLATWTVPPAVVRATIDQAPAWRSTYPELFGRGFVSIDRYFVSGDGK